MNTSTPDLVTVPDLLTPFRPGFPMMVDSLGYAMNRIEFPNLLVGQWYVRPDCKSIPDMLVSEDERSSTLLYPSQEFTPPACPLVRGGFGIKDMFGYYCQYIESPIGLVSRYWEDDGQVFIDADCRTSVSML